MAVRLPTIKDLQDLFTDLADYKAKVKSTLRLIFDMTLVIDIDIRLIMCVFYWFIANIVDPNFVCTDFTWAVYMADKRARAVAMAVKTSIPAATTTTTVRSTIDVSDGVLLADGIWQATPPTPGTTHTLKSHKLWKSPFAAASRNSSNIRKLHNTDLVLASSKPLDVIEFYLKLIVATTTAEIDLIPFTQFNLDWALWPMNHCADIVFEINNALALNLYQTGTLNLDDETINILYQKHITDSTSGICAYSFVHALLKKAKWKLNERMLMPPGIEQATSFVSFIANLERYYLQLITIGVTFENKIKL
jgi:hypothetical protein